MRVHEVTVKISTIAVIIFAAAILGTPVWGQGGPPPPEQMAGKTAGQYFKNIKVLNNVPAAKLLDGMRYMTVALGVECEFCHNTRNFPSDQKKTKQTARKMMKMLFAIDKDNFNGTTRVSCYTCHRGHHEPPALPVPPQEVAMTSLPAPVMRRPKMMKIAAGTSVPTPDQILAKYAEALGGAQALASVKSRVIEVERSAEGKGERPTMQQIYEKAPGKFLIVTHYQKRTGRTGGNGKEMWVATPFGSRRLDGLDVVYPTQEAQLNPADALAHFTNKRVTAMAQVGDRKAYVLTAKAPDGTLERFFFDTQSGLLLRRISFYRTIFGALLFEAEYSDYQKEGGVVLPLKTTWWTANEGWTETVKSVKTNVPLSDARFQPPPRKAGAPRARL